MLPSRPQRNRCCRRPACQARIRIYHCTRQANRISGHRASRLVRVERLQTRIAGVLNAPDLAHGFWGIEVASLATGEALYAQNADKLFTPASNTKLFTTAAALALIGPDYKFRTTVETTGTLDRYGRLNGDLVLVGHGDPNLSGRELPYDSKPSATMTRFWPSSHSPTRS